MIEARDHGVGPQDIARTVDYHTGGEPFRLVVEPGIDIVGTTVAVRRIRAALPGPADDLRRLLCFEPRGHADMYGGFLVPADDDSAQLGVLFWHKDGFSTACGHGTIALGVWAVESGLVPRAESGTTDVVIDTPSGRVTARVHTTAERVTAVDFDNVASYAVAEHVPLQTSLGAVSVDIGFGGAIYAMLDARSVGLAVVPEQLSQLTAIGREIKWLLNDSAHAQHRSDSRLSGIYGTIVYEDLGRDRAGRRHQRNATVFADGELDRSPCGSGTCARLATLIDQGLLAVGDVFVHDSIVGSRFEATALAAVEVDGQVGVLPRVTGMAYRTGESQFSVDPHDPQVPGFVLR